MTRYRINSLPEKTVGMRLYRIDTNDLGTIYDTITFCRGRTAVDIILRRATIAGTVEVGGTIPKTGPAYMADLVDAHGDIVDIAALDIGSFNYLKNKMRPRVATTDRANG